MITVYVKAVVEPVGENLLLKATLSHELRLDDILPQSYSAFRALNSQSIPLFSCAASCNLSGLTPFSDSCAGSYAAQFPG